MTAKDFEMNKVLKLRNRAFHMLILGLVGLTFFAYYRTGVNEIRPFVAERLGSKLFFNNSLLQLIILINQLIQLILFPIN